MPLILGRKLQRKTGARGRCRTRSLTEGVTPSLHGYYPNPHLKPYPQEGRALRTETTINNPYDFGVGRRLVKLSPLRQIGFAANRRGLEVEPLSPDCHIGAEAFAQLPRPARVEGQHVAALPFGQARVPALFTGRVLCSLQPQGVPNKQLRPLRAHLLGFPESDLTPGRMSYDLRRLRLHGLLERIPHPHRYRLTLPGMKTARFYARVYPRLLRPGLSPLNDPTLPERSPLAAASQRLQAECDTFISQQLAA